MIRGGFIFWSAATEASIPGLRAMSAVVSRLTHLAEGRGTRGGERHYAY